MMKDAESGERGFLLTGDESYLAPYNSAIAALPRGLKELKDLTSDNPRQQARCDRDQSAYRRETERAQACH